MREVALRTIGPPSRRDILQEPPWSYVLAVIVPTTVLLLLQAAGVFVDRLPSAPLLAAVLAVAWYCGRLPALLSTAISIVFHAYTLIPSPRRGFDVADAVALIFFAGLAVFVSYATPRLGQSLRELDLERKREQNARSEAERHSREAHELRRLSRALTHTDSATAAAQRVVDAVMRLFESSAVVRLLESDGAMVAVAVAGENPVVTPGHRMPAGSGVVGQAVTQRKLVMTNSVLMDPRLDLPSAVRDQHERLRHQLVIAAPLIVDGVVIGTLALNETEPRTFMESELALLQPLANHAAVGIRNAQRFEHERTARQEAEATSRTKDEFLAMLSHELRNPLAAIGSAIAVLNRLSGGDERAVHARGRHYAPGSASARVDG
jgi:K+-sensing histidine kinase KdpD